MPRGVHGNHVKGTAHPRWKGGHVNKRGYVQVYDPRLKRPVEAQTKLYRDLAAIWSYYPLDNVGTPIVLHWNGSGTIRRLHGHHFDGDRGNNAVGNLIFMEPKLHRAIRRLNAFRDPETGRFLNAEAWADKYGEEI